MKIVYLGNKEIKADNVAASGLVWTRGQIHEVEDAVKAAKLLEHPLIWADAGKEYELLPQLAAVSEKPVAKFIAKDSPFLDSFILQVPDEILKQLHDKSLIPVFMTTADADADADAFAEWKLERDTRPDAEPTDKRTKEWKDWSTRHGKAA